MRTTNGRDLLEEFERTGDLTILRTAIELLRADSEAAVTLSEALRLLGEETADIAALDDAARIARQAMTDAAPGSARHLAAGNNLALALWAKADQTGNDTVLTQTVAALRDIAQAAGEDPHAVRYDANLGLALRELFGVTGERETLAEAVTALRRADHAAGEGADRRSPSAPGLRVEPRARPVDPL